MLQNCSDDHENRKVLANVRSFTSATYSYTGGAGSIIKLAESIPNSSGGAEGAEVVLMNFVDIFINFFNFN